MSTSPHSVVSEEVKSAFRERKCYLPALFDGLDPFDCGDKFTVAAFDSEGDVVKPVSKTITEAQHKEIIDLIGDDKAYHDKLLATLKKTMSIESFKDIPKDKFNSLLKSVKIHSDERLKQETAGVPF